MKFFLAAATIVITSIYTAQVAHAHVLITDETQSTGAILHIIPDDDPIAGEEATLFFDIQDATLSNNKRKIDVTIKTSNGETTRLPMSLDGSLATAKYTFPVQGQYDMVFRLETPQKTYILDHTQRVSRGAIGSPLEKPTYAWAEMTLVACLTGAALITIMAFNRRHAIARRSTF